MVQVQLLLARKLQIALFVLLASGGIAQAQELQIARQGYLFAGGRYEAGADGQYLTGQAYVEYQIPARQTHPFPVVMIEGGGQSGSNFTGTPDGREGWAQDFLAQGYAVYVMDQPGRGRSPIRPEYGDTVQRPASWVEQQFTAPERFKLWPQAVLHNQWPGTGVAGDPVFDQFYAEQLPSIASFATQQALNRDAGVALLDRIGPAILLTHSQSGAFGWPIADARPNLVKAIVAVEPSGPPVHDAIFKGAPNWFADGPLSKPWGLTAVPLTYDGVKDAGELSFGQQQTADSPQVVKCWRQRQPAHQLTNLRAIPVAVFSSEASYHASYDHCTAQYLEQAGVKNSFIRLADRGIHGNGHMMMLEKNNLAIARLIVDWMDANVH